MDVDLFAELERISERPAPFSAYTAEDLWADPHTSERMLAFHLDGDVDLASRSPEFIRRSVDWLISHFGLGTDTRVLDLGCGPGLYANALAQAGVPVVGVDFSERSIRHARETTPDVPTPPTFIHGNYLDLAVPGTFDLTLMAMCDYCALSPSQRATLLDRVHGALSPEGAFVFDVYGLATLDSRTETTSYEPGLMNGFWAPGPYFGFMSTFVYPVERVTLDKYVIVEPDRTRSIYNWLQYFDTDSLAGELASAGFRLAGVFGDLTGATLPQAPTEFCAVARPI